MNLTRCSKGHYYDMDKFNTCPHCSNASERMGETVRYTHPAAESGNFVPQFQSNQASAGYMNPTVAFEAGGTYGEPGANSDSPTVDYTEPADELSSMVAKTMRKPNGTKEEDDSATISFGHSGAKADVVGWVVIIDGEEKGKSFTLKTGRNFIGRNASQDVVLAKDKSVSREKHAIIVYEPRQRQFLVQPGDSRELFYLNDRVVLGSEELKAYDVLLVGTTQLAFVPFCGDSFSWENGLEKEGK